MAQLMASQHSNVSATQLDAAYRATTYIAYLPDSVLKLRVDEPCRKLDRFLEHSGCSTWAFISACNPGSHLLSETENSARHASLIETVDKLGLKWQAGKGMPDSPSWSPETSLLILGISHRDALVLASQFGQNAILFGTRGNAPQLDYLIGNSPDNSYS
jgi:hypothetical protein